MIVRGVTLVVLLVVGVGTTSATAAAPRVVVSPTPGVVVKGNTLQIVVRGAGDEHGDLSAKLNGRQVGREFKLGVSGRRVLRVSLSHGLRHGRNVLHVTARRGVRTRRATVRFTVRRTAHLVGAGRHRFLTVGTPAEIAHETRAAPGGRRPRATRLEITRTPPGSRLARLDSRQPAHAVRQATLPLTPLQPALTPDLPGRYTVRVTVGSGRAAVHDEVTMDARPNDPLVRVDTFPSDVGDRPAMGLGDATYPAPYLSAADGTGQYARSGGGVAWNAEWHVIAVSRSTSQILWQRTYGFCRFEGQPARECRAPDAGPAERPVIVDSQAEVSALAPGKAEGAGAIIIARSLPTAGAGADELGFLPAIGYQRRPRGADAPHNHLHSVIGVPGMGKGRADMSGVQSRGWLRGFLTPDQNERYHFLRGQRPLFDTRGPGTTCTATPAQCTVAHTVDGTVVSGTVPAGRGGYFVSAWHPETLAPRHAEFVTIDNDSTASQDGTRGLLALLQRFRDDGSVILLSTQHTAGMDPGTLIGGPPDSWNALTDLIASIGGTTDGFLRSVSTPGAEYTLLGWGGAGEGGGREAGGAGNPARLRGALLTDNNGNFIEPANVSSIGPPAERLSTLMITPTSTDWKYPPGTPEGDAIACIGAALEQGIDIRSGYRDYGDTLALALRGDVTALSLAALKPVVGTGLTCTPTQQQFDDAKAQLVGELGHVAKVRIYLHQLSSPDLLAGDRVWGQAVTLGDELDEVLEEEEEQREVIASSLGLAATLLDLIAPGISTFLSGKNIKKITHAVEASAAAFELVSRSIERDSAGRENEDVRAQAHELATKLQNKAQTTVAAFEQLGDVIVSDPQKLAEVGGNYHCKIGPGGCPEGMEEYSTTDADIKELTDVVVRGMGREIYSTLVPRMYQTWDAGLTAFPSDVFAHFFCVGSRSPFNVVPSDQYAASLERVNHGQRNLYRIYLSVRSATYWEAIPKEVAERMFGEPGESWNVGGLGMDLLTYLREMDERFSPGTYTCGFDG